MTFSPERGEGFIPEDEMAEMDEPVEHTEAELEASRAETDRLAEFQAAERDKYRPEQPAWKKWLGIGKGKTEPREILQEQAHRMNKEVDIEVQNNYASSTTQAVENLARREINVSPDDEMGAQMNEHHRYLQEKYGDDWMDHLSERDPLQNDRREFRKGAGLKRTETRKMDHTTVVHRVRRKKTEVGK